MELGQQLERKKTWFQRKGRGRRAEEGLKGEGTATMVMYTVHQAPPMVRPALATEPMDDCNRNPCPPTMNA